MIRSCFLLFVFAIVSTLDNGLKATPNKNLQFLAYSKVPAWVGVASGWDHANPQLHFYDPSIYGGHADFVSKGLKTGVNFKQFKELVSHPSSRQYLPFFIYDLAAKAIEIDGKKHFWALHLEDYSYTDKPEELQEAILRLLKLLKAEFENKAGVVLLATNPQVKPNTEIKYFLSSKGFPNLTRSEMLNNFGGLDVQILNPGTTYGYLKYLPAGKEKTEIPNTNDIVIYEQLPKRIYPVRGIISIEPQHALSHINLLAINRGTINLSMPNLEHLPNASKLIGQLVKFECVSEKIIIAKANIKEAERYWLKHQKIVSIAQPIMGSGNLVDLEKDDKTATSIENIGAKAANYSILLKLSKQNVINADLVKPGFAIPFYWYLDFIEHNGLSNQVSELSLHYSKMTLDERASALKKLREAITSGDLSITLAKTIRNKIGPLATSRIRLRSSTNCEDLADFNGAGLYKSKGFDMDGSDQDLIDKIKTIYASLWSQQAFAERSYFGIDHAQAAMGILISPAYTDEFANGVLMTISSNNNTYYQINSQIGSYSVSNPKGSERSETLLFDNQFSLQQVQQESSIQSIFLDTNLNVTKTELLIAASILHKEFVKDSKLGIDIEFKIIRVGNKFELYIKQVRIINNHTLPE